VAPKIVLQLLQQERPGSLKGAGRFDSVLRPVMRAAQA
jgi:hypothetical protein